MPKRKPHKRKTNDSKVGEIIAHILLVALACFLISLYVGGESFFWVVLAAIILGIVFIRIKGLWHAAYSRRR